MSRSRIGDLTRVGQPGLPIFPRERRCSDTTPADRTAAAGAASGGARRGAGARALRSRPAHLHQRSTGHPSRAPGPVPPAGPRPLAGWVRSRPEAARGADAGPHPHRSRGGPGRFHSNDYIVQRRHITTWHTSSLSDAPAGSTPYDFREPGRIGDLHVDAAYADVQRSSDGLATVTLSTEDGRGARLWCDGSFGYLQVFTGDTLPADRRRRAVPVEPITCPADAFNPGRVSSSSSRARPGRGRGAFARSNAERPHSAAVPLYARRRG